MRSSRATRRPEGPPEPAPGAEPAAGADDRLRTVLAANRSVVSELALPAVLRRIVEAAREVARARYAALGVLGVDGRLEQFVHSGLDAPDVERIGHLPTGRGVLGAVIEDAAPIRLHRIADDRRSAGFPDGHPPMQSFLGVPVRSRGEVFGNLYLADRLDGTDFTEADEELVVALAASAGVAVENARLYEESRLRQEWLRASAEITSDLLRPGLGSDVLVRIADAVLRLADADVVAIALPRATRAQPDGDGPEGRRARGPDHGSTTDDDELLVEVARGLGADELVGTSYPAPAVAQLAAAALRERSAVLADTPGPADPRLRHRVRGSSDAPVMACPLVDEAGVRGAVVVARGPGSRPFGVAEVEMAEQFAAHAAVALELADRRTDEERLVLLEDRHRIARDLHDHVIQRIFATGLLLDAARTRRDPDAVSAAVGRAVDDLDETIRQIRATIFELQDATTADVRSALLTVVGAASSGLGFEPTLHLEGPVATVVDPDLLHDVTAVLREALTNVVKHARATGVTVTVAASAETVTVEVTDTTHLPDADADTDDDRTGVPTDDPTGDRPEGAGDGPARAYDPRDRGGHGLRNLRVRARARGGESSLRSHARGRTLTWTVPLTS
ncbi:sensor histidine kinase [Terrabacter aeriphilus]